MSRPSTADALWSKSDSARPTAAAAGATCLGYKYQQSAAQIPFPLQITTSFPDIMKSLLPQCNVGIMWHHVVINTNIAWKGDQCHALDAEIKIIPR